ncbi:MAG: ATP-binding protein [Armatimonadetes bacterium]|nr:ATP-binding protein [Armatimonadota bacterium]
MRRSTDDLRKVKSLKWQERVRRLLQQGRVQRALNLLDKIAREPQYNLFDQDGIERQKAWLFKIDVLRSKNKVREALAWTLLECEIHPENVTAQAMKIELKEDLGYEEIPHWESSRTRESTDSGIWHGVAGMRELKVELESSVILPLRQPALFNKFKLALPNGVILYGPPGCGKTFIANRLAKILEFEFFDVKPSDLGSIYIHGTQGKIKKLFDDAREAAPSMIFLDEIDSMIPRRTDVHQHAVGEVSEFLTQLNKAAEDRILVVGATNNLDSLDPAAIRPGRFDKLIFVGLPDFEAREELFHVHLDERPIDELDYKKMAEQSEGLTCADIEVTCSEAAHSVVLDERKIRTDDVLIALGRRKPKFDEEEYRKIGFDLTNKRE